ncbi:MAG TPA: hypothetical protein VGF60_06055 [Xanthobacteraceae bacterium]|jgi:hypothetical protein
MRVTDLDTGKDFFLDITPELEADLAPVDALCSHPQKQLRQRRNRGGAIQYIEQCLRCGNSVGFFRKHTPNLVASPAWDDKLQDNFYAARQGDREAIIQKHVRIQRSKSEGFWKEYNLYLKTGEWQQKRAKVLQRANGQCEGCGMKPAAEVHHLTYNNVFAEFLFELVAVCDACHSRLHEDDPDLGEFFGHRCRDCRRQADHQGKVWCLFFGISADEALANEDQCGLERIQFAPLK